jgi:hypothetical protein
MVSYSWLEGFVKASMVEAERRDPQSARWLREAGGILLFGSFGTEAYLRPDGSVWYHETEDWGAQSPAYAWREAEGKDRLGALVLGSRRIPKLRRLLPER